MVRGASSHSLTGRRVLVVDDHETNRLVLLSQLRSWGIVADVAANDVAGDGVEALAALERRTYDGVLMDCHMPEVDGFKATANIRRCEAGARHVPIIAMIAATLVDDREQCIAAGMDDYLSKPVKSVDLEAVLNRWLVGAHGPPKIPQREPAPHGDGVLDTAQFHGLRKLAEASGGPDFLRSIVDQYTEGATSQMAGMREATTRGDVSMLRGLAHGLRGISATMGATNVALACAALEQAAARGELAGMEVLATVAQEVAEATAALRAEAPAGSSS